MLPDWLWGFHCRLGTSPRLLFRSLLGFQHPNRHLYLTKKECAVNKGWLSIESLEEGKWQVHPSSFLFWVDSSVMYGFYFRRSKVLLKSNNSRPQRVCGSKQKGSHKKSTKKMTEFTDSNGVTIQKVGISYSLRVLQTVFLPYDNANHKWTKLYR